MKKKVWICILLSVYIALARVHWPVTVSKEMQVIDMCE